MIILSLSNFLIILIHSSSIGGSAAMAEKMSDQVHVSFEKGVFVLYHILLRKDCSPIVSSGMLTKHMYSL